MLELRKQINELDPLAVVDETTRLAGQNADGVTGRLPIGEIVDLARGYLDAFVRDVSGGIVSTGKGDVYSVISHRPVTAIEDGFCIAFQADRANTTTHPTIVVSSLGPYDLQVGGGAAPAIGDIAFKGIYIASFVASASAFRIHAVPQALLAKLASPAFTGTPTAPTPTAGDNSSKLATTAYVRTEFANFVGAAPVALDTILELAAALNNDPNFATTMVNALALKAALASPAFTGTPTAPTPLPGDNSTKLATTAYADNAAAVANRAGQRGQCVLVKSGSNIVLMPRNGNNVLVNGVFQVIPSGGVSLAPAGLTVGALYYIYAYMSGGVLTLVASTTGHATDATYGHEVKSDDATRTLVGMVRPAAGPSFADTAVQRFVRSWFNRGSCNLTSGVAGSTGSINYVQATASLLEVLLWSGELFDVAISGGVYNNTAGATTYTAIGVDSVTVASGAGGGSSASNGLTVSGAARVVRDSLVEGYHYAAALLKVTSGSGTFDSGTSPRIDALVN